ncbi:MAG: hypothetical protein NXY57DRAFT_1066602 [Lentinula lateritia]|nr:MAG: hypothetical protein NXY57DRAFT_1066602 [Lentinula lateritia]
MSSSVPESQLSELEALADKVIREVRATEAVYSPSFPGMEFLTGISPCMSPTNALIHGSKQMPKGGFFHVHLDATVNVSFLLKTAMKYPDTHVRASTALNATNIGHVLPEMSALPQHLHTAGQIALADHDYIPDIWVPMLKARESFDPKLGGPSGFYRWITAALTISPTEAYVTHNTVAKIWPKFQSTFIVSAPLVRYQPIQRQYFRGFVIGCIADGISYVEPRINFLRDAIPFIAEDSQRQLTHREVLKDFEDVVGEVKAELKAKDREDDFITSKIIYSTIRFITPAELEWYLRDCIALMKEFPHLIAGFDLVGDENFREMQKEAGFSEISFIFHGGETLGDGTEADMNLYDAILLGTKRIGHGFSLVKHPKLIELCKECGIAVEVCPTSYWLTSSIHMHPLPVLLNQGVPVALCSDDPSVFGNMGLTFDYFQVLAASKMTGLVQLGKMAKDSIKFLSMEPEEKAHALGAWQKRWEIFLEYAVVEGQKFLT